MKDSDGQQRSRIHRLTIFCLLIATGCVTAAAFAQNNDATGGRVAPFPQPNTAADSDRTELWLFGPIVSPQLTTPLGARGVRSIIDLRHSPKGQAVRILKIYADRGLGLAFCFRWRNPSTSKTKVKKTQNGDVPPTPQEADRAIAELKEILGSQDAKRIGNRLFVQFYNEVGGGPGAFPLDKTDELLAFATRAAAEIRKVNSQLRICGPAITGGQLQARRSSGSRKMKEKAQVIRKAISWSAEHADVIDLHLHAVDGKWVRTAVQSLRNNLDKTPRGRAVRFVSFEWSCARYPDRNNDRGVRKAILGIWEAMNDFKFICAAYGPYWPLKNKASKKVADLFGWISIVKAGGQRNPPIYETLQQIGGGNGIDEPQSKRGRSRSSLAN